jgi:2,4-dienoyl-CoA reductase-like NADH-dependent reductase (Old Yellow Enzyme family)/thioredoxin reductase
MQKYKNVFSPFKLGNLEIKNRIEIPPMLSCLATPEGYVTQEMIEFYKSFAQGGAGIVTIGDTGIDNEYSRGHYSQTHVGDDSVITGLNALVEAIQAYGAKVSIELNHSGRNVGQRMLKGKNPIGSTAEITEREEMEAWMQGRKPVPVLAMDQEMIDRVIEQYANACYRCLTAGFEMVMIHGAHGQLPAQFASPYINKRTDKYGGSIENRARFAVEMLTAIRKKVGDKLVIEYRISADELVNEGLHVEQTIEFIKIIQDKVDLIHTSLGGLTLKHIPYMSQPTYLPYAFNAERAEKIRKAIKVPVTCVGSIIDLEIADRVIAEGKADIVAMGRANIADPQLISKTYRGITREIRPCLRCGVCGGRPAEMLQVRCAVNPVTGREVEYKNLVSAKIEKNVVIVGGGPAGMEAAEISLTRGHKVTLLEKDKVLGGALRAAAAPEFKPDMKKYLDWAIRRTLNPAINIHLSARVTQDYIKSLKPDVLIIAVGAEPFIPDIPGIKNANVVTASDVHLGKAKTGDNVVVAGAGLTGCETALHLAKEGKKVTIIDMISEADIAKDTSMATRALLLEWLHSNNVKLVTEVKLTEIKDNGVIVADSNQNKIEIPADTVVLSLGVVSRSKEVQKLRELAPEVFVVGDCLKPRNLMASIHDAFNIAAEI